MSFFDISFRNYRLAGIALAIFSVAQYELDLRDRGPLPPGADFPGETVDVTVGKSNHVGGGGGDSVKSVTITPEVMAPNSVNARDSFLVGIKLSVSDAEFVHRGTVDHGPLGSIEIGVPLGTYKLKDAPEEYKGLPNAEEFTAKLFLAGAQSSPKESQVVRANGVPVFWSVKAAEDGTLNGWVSLTNSGTRIIDGMSRTTFSVVAKTPVVPRFQQAVTWMGGALGTLLATVPGWFAFFLKGRDKPASADVTRNAAIEAETVKLMNARKVSKITSKRKH